MKIVKGAALASLSAGIETLAELKAAPLPELDPNHWETMRKSQEGLARIPCAITKYGERSSPRERLLGAEKRHPERLHILSETFVVELLYDEQTPEEPRVIGVRVLPRKHVYEADARAVDPPADWREQAVDIYCTREVILCGGSFNTPQLLMLSGIGPRQQLEQQGVDVRRESPCVGRHLQDRYEVPISAVVSDRFRLLDPLEFTSKADNDPELREWIENRGQPPGTNIYATNAGLIGIFKRSSREERIPDLFIFALAGYFPGYHVGYSQPSALAPNVAPNNGAQTGAARHKRYLTWLVLKARSRNNTGTVELRSASPFRRPKINFNVLPDDLPGEDGNNDLQAIYEGVEFVQACSNRTRRKV